MAVALALSLAALFALCTDAAQAEPPKLISYGTINQVRFPSGVAVDNSCVLHEPTLTGLACSAFDPSAGDVYVGAFALSRINKFNAANELIAPSPFGAGSERYSGEIVNPANGTLYVLDAVNSEIDPYDPLTGQLIENASEKPFAVPSSHNFLQGNDTIVQIGADSAGNVYVPVIPESKVIEYSSVGVLLHEFTGGSGAGALKAPSGVAVDSSGNLWVADTGNNRIEELDPSGAPVEVGGKRVEIKSEGVQTLALDGHGDVLAIVKNSEDGCGSVNPPCSHLVEYDSTGASVADVGAGSFEGGGGAGPLPPMLAINGADGRIYVTSASIAGTSLVFIFGPPTAPIVDNELTAEVTTSEVKLGALVNPGGLAATYRFEYDTREYKEGEGSHGMSAPFPEGNVGEGLESHAVWAAASGLEPGTIYHYRVVATNEVGVSVGRDQTFTTLTAAQAACPNSEERVGFSARLPDCRAYELVTPPAINSTQVTAEKAGGYGNLAFLTAVNGNAISFTTKEPLPGAPSSGATYVAKRGEAGWSSEDVAPLEEYSAVDCSSYDGKVRAYSEDLSKLIVSSDMFSNDSAPSRREASGELSWEYCNAEGRQVVSGEPVGYENLLLRDSDAGVYRLVNEPEPGVTSVPADAHFQGASSDLSHVVFSEPTPLTSTAAPGVESLYEWDEGVIRLVSVLPDGTPVEAAIARTPREPVGLVTSEGRAVSRDGSHIVFTSHGGLYVRVNAQRTVQIDESHGGSGVSGGGVFQGASVDGQEVFFTDEGKLTENSTAASGAPDLYECELPEGASKCALSDLTVAAAGEHADVLQVSVPDNDSSHVSHVYFVAKGELASNERAYTNADGVETREKAQSGQQNLYLWDGKALRFIATGEAGFDTTDLLKWSPDGEWFSFTSKKSMTGYDNVTSGGAIAPEVYLYSALSNAIVCASCNPSGQAPVLLEESGLGALQGGVFERSDSVAAAEPHELFDSGRLFFHTREALVPSDTNGQTDVYEYEDGHVYLISSGTSSIGSAFIDASENGENVFFLTVQQLVPQDTEPSAQVIYDARVNGGFPAVASPPPCTTADSCRAPVSPQPSIYGAPSSQTFSGAGNLAPSSVEVRPKKKKTTKAGSGNPCKRIRNRHKRAACEAKRTHRKRKTGKSHKGGK